MVQRRARRLAVPPTASPTDPLTATDIEEYDGAPPIDSKNLFVITTMKLASQMNEIKEDPRLS